jgi:hypothetical protein
MGSKYLEYNPGLEQNIVLQIIEQWKKESDENTDQTNCIKGEQ